ncbi:MAG TPA: TIGR03621 family F420-dependent LLM class oxidoreductase [Candidatus Dormibacteraeota bacterium]|nr:TIGR03621 family F420-dependent LLM class oxidoreductase [Candidatus Dormibacteraeota bacterium]
MTGHRPFRFSVQEHRARDAKHWREKAQAVESMGYTTLYLPDHFNDQLGVIAALMAAADATTKLRIGSLVFDNDYRHPVVLAKEAATLDLLSEGRLDLGVGAGWLASDYESAGIAYDSTGTRIERLEEALTILKKCFTGQAFSFEGKHYTIKDFEGSPLPVQKPHPRFVLGGGGRRMLRLAAREGDIVHVNYNLNEGRVNPKLVQTGMAAATDEKLAWIKEAAGERMEQIELGFTVFFVNVTDDRDSLAEAMAPSMGFAARDVLEMPHVLIGTIDQLEEDLKLRRDRYGFSDVIVPGEAAEQLSLLVERLAGK